MIQLFPDEQLLIKSTDGGVTLTTHRIAYGYKNVGSSYNQSIMLEHITSCENTNKTKIWLLIISGFFFIRGISTITNGGSGESIIIIFIAILFALFYRLTRINLVTIASPSTKMLINVNGMKRERVLEFINKVEQAKHRRVLALNGYNSKK